MYIKQATVNNQVGLHARPATFFIQKANEFKSTIWVEKDEQRVNAKSLLGVLSLGIIKGSTIDLIADGTDEKDAVDALVELTGVLGLLYAREKENGDAEVEALIAARAQARARKDWAEADHIRDQIKELGIVLEDTPQGVKWHRA